MNRVGLQFRVYFFCREGNSAPRPVLTTGDGWNGGKHVDLEKNASYKLAYHSSKGASIYDVRTEGGRGG